MAGPQVQQHHKHSTQQRPTSAYYVSTTIAGLNGASSTGITSSATHTGLHALRQMSNENELIYRGSNGSTFNNEASAASTSRGIIHQQPLTISGSNPYGVGGGGGSAGNIVSIAGPGPSASDALIPPATGLTRSQRSVEIIVDATQCGRSEDDIEQGGTLSGGDGEAGLGESSGKSGRSKSRHRRHRPLHRRLLTYLRSLFQGSDTQNDSELEEFETPARYRPDSLSALSRATRFTEEEIKRIYRGFKAECPTGVVKEDTFKIIYSQFFPQGANPTLYAHYVFNTLDQDRSGIVSFEDFVQGLSILSRGSVEEKLRWTFSLYDINGDGFITREEMTDIVTAIYELMGRLPDECPEEEKIKGKVEQIFQKMDINRDGVVTLEEFLEACRNDDAISRSMSVFDTTF